MKLNSLDCTLKRTVNSSIDSSLASTPSLPFTNISLMASCANELKQYVTFKAIFYTTDKYTLFGKDTTKVTCIDPDTVTHSIEFIAKSVPNNLKRNDIIEVHHAYLRTTDYGLSLSDSAFTQIKFVGTYSGDIAPSIVNISQTADSIACGSWESSRSVKPNSLISITTTLINAELRSNKFISLTLQDKYNEIQYCSIWSAKNLMPKYNDISLVSAVKDLSTHLGEDISLVLRIKKKRQLDDKFPIYYNVESIINLITNK